MIRLVCISFHGFGLCRKVFYYIHAIIHWISYIALNDWHKQYKPRTAWTGNPLNPRLPGNANSDHFQAAWCVPCNDLREVDGVEVDKSWGLTGRPCQGAPLLLMRETNEDS